VDLESGQIDASIRSPDLAFRGGNTPLLQVLGPGHIAYPPGGADRENCTARLKAPEDSLAYYRIVELLPNSPLCVQTHNGHVAELHVVSVPGHGSEEIVFTYTVWQ